jgi:hypothetical protein
MSKTPSKTTPTKTSSSLSTPKNVVIKPSPTKTPPQEQDLLIVKVISGKFFEKQDVFGKGDPYVVVKFDKISKKTKVFKNTLSATFNEGEEYVLI